MIFKKKPCSISGIITRQPSSMARLRVSRNPGGGPERQSRERTVWLVEGEPRRLLSLAGARFRSTGGNGTARRHAADRRQVPRLRLSENHRGVAARWFRGQSQARAAPDAPG